MTTVVDVLDLVADTDPDAVVVARALFGGDEHSYLSHAALPLPQVILKCHMSEQRVRAAIDRWVAAGGMAVSESSILGTVCLMRPLLSPAALAASNISVRRWIAGMRRAPRRYRPKKTAGVAARPLAG